MFVSRGMPLSPGEARPEGDVCSWHLLVQCAAYACVLPNTIAVTVERI
jgi:hypothetical protein